MDGIVLFKDDADYDAFYSMLEESCGMYPINIHAYIVMPTYFEFLATPQDPDTLPRFMQSLGRRYVGYFNKRYGRSGTLWEGRYKASIVESELYLFDVMGYIEKQMPPAYMYASTGRNLLGKKDRVVTCHGLYRGLGYTDAQRLEKYARIFGAAKDAQKSGFIAQSLQRQSVTGSEAYVRSLENIVGTALAAKGRGRPKKENEEKRKKMYKNLVVLDKAAHKELKISPLENLNFARSSTFIPVVANEVSQVGATFPVVFTSEENPSLVSLVSLGGDSLAINNEGKWISAYVPSHIRKYPFSMASAKENPQQKVILIDDESPLFSKTKGKQLFKKDGEPSETLSHAINFLSAHENQMLITRNVAKVIADSGILEEREISVGEGEEKKVLVKGFKVVDREKLNALSDDILADWVRKGIIAMIEAHIKSLENIQRLFSIAQQRQR